jgi:hypothetical protein
MCCAPGIKKRLIECSVETNEVLRCVLRIEAALLKEGENMTQNFMEFPGGDRLYIVLSRSDTVLSRMVHWLTGAEVTHAAISLDAELNYMFTFGRRWASNPFIGCFRRERLDEGAYRKATDLPGVVLELRVSPAQFQAVSAMLGDFLLNYYRYEFNCLGLAKQAIGRYHMKDNQFFCSEFVYYVLHSCGICDLKRPRGSVRPQDLLTIGRVIYRGDLLRYSGGSVQTLQSSAKAWTEEWSNMPLRRSALG